MGLGGLWLFRVLAISNVATVVFVAVDIHQNLGLRHDLQQLQREICYLQDSIHQVSTPGGPSDPSPAPGGSALNPPHQPEVGKGTPVRASGSGTDLGTFFGYLLICLVLLLVAGLWRSRSRPKCIEAWGANSPSSQKDLAHRQLAELRLRRHGFGQ